MRILICTDGSDSSVSSAKLVNNFRFPASTEIVIMGVSENKSQTGIFTESIRRIEKDLSGDYKISQKMRYGTPTNEILAEAFEGSYDLVVLGGGGVQKELLHPLGSTTSQLVRKLHTHFLVVRGSPDRLMKILVCTGIESPIIETMKLGGEWLSNIDAKIKLLHVIPSGRISSAISNYEYLIERATQQLHRAGVRREITPIIRQGMVVNEVLGELTDGGYDLLVIGSHYQPGQDIWKGTLFDDVTDQLLNQSSCSVLII